MAAQKSLGFLDYLKEAFHVRAPVPLLGPMPVNYLGLALVAVLGIANPGFWLLGAAAEITFLAMLTTNRRFQNLIDARQLQAVKESYESRVKKALERLQPKSRERYYRLLEQGQKVLGLSEVLEENDMSGLRKMRSGGLNQLLWIFLRLLTSREVLADNLARVDESALEAEIANLEKRIGEAGAESQLARALSGTLDIQRRRLANYERANESMLVVEAELERIEQQIVLLREEAAVSGKAEILSNRLDAVTSTMSETNRWMEQNAELFGELGADPLGTVPADLPDVPRAMEVEE
jgi:hypothetical protein